MVQDILSQTIGDYLLKGWVLTNETCQVDGLPLLRTKDRSTYYCPGEEDHPRTDSKPKQDQQEFYAKREKAISEMGQYLLKGWTMLERECPTCQVMPLLKKGSIEQCTFCPPQQKVTLEPIVTLPVNPPAPTLSTLATAPTTSAMTESGLSILQVKAKSLQYVLEKISSGIDNKSLDTNELKQLWDLANSLQ